MNGATADKARETQASAAEIKRLISAARHASLATADHATGRPFASLVNYAPGKDGAPVLLISSLARHTANLQHNPAGSLLIADPALSGSDVLTGSRVTLTGLFEPIAEPVAMAQARDAYLSRHPSAAGYAGFADFSWWRLQIDEAHLVQGFGRIATLKATELG
jgi:putative heme iron utilization protein